MARHADFRFRPLAEADLPLLCEWLTRPHLRQWWREGDVSLDAIRDKYLPRLTGLDDARPFLACLDGMPAGYIQFYLACQGSGDWWPDNARAIRCYAKVGFREICPITTPDGPALMMVLDRG